MNSLPKRVRAVFEGDDLEGRFGLAYELVTVDEDGWPRVAMLSHGEIMTTPNAIRFLLWAGTNTGKNLDSGRPALLSVVSEGFVSYVSGRAVRLGASSEFDSFELSIERVRMDAHEGFKVLGPITFAMENGETGDAIAEWRRQLEILSG